MTTVDEILNDIELLPMHERQALIAELFQRFPTYHPIKFIETVVCNYFKLFPEEIFAKNRKQEIARARQMIMYLARKHTNLSLHKIGAYCGHKDHATVLHACKTIEKLIQKDVFIEKDVNILSKHLQGLKIKL